MQPFTVGVTGALKYPLKLQPQVWLWELTSTLVALLSTLAIFLILLLHNGQLLGDRLFYFTLNSLLSIFATVLRIAVAVAVSSAIFQLGYVWFTKPRPLDDLEVFNAASRGIAGSLRLIWLQRGRGWASLGAFLFILVLLNDTFVQQIVTFPTKEITKDVSATIGRNSIYDEWIPGEEEDVKGIALSMSAAIMTGLYNADITPLAIKPNCPTGQCTWPPVYTQAIRSKCSNVGSLVESSCPEGKLPQNCTFFLPNDGPALNGQQSLLNSTAVILNSDSYNTSTMIFPNIPRQLATFQIISQTTGSDINVKAMQCILYLSIDTYNSSVVNGTLNEKCLSTWTDTNFIPPGTPDWVSNPSQIPGGPYCMSYNSAISLQNYFWMLFSGSVGGSDDSSIPSSDTMGLFAALMSAGTLAARMENLALAMTYHLRGWSAPNSTNDSNENTVFGDVKEYRAYYHVNWLWFILPASLPCLTLILLLSTMHLAQKKALSTFKSSPTALIFAGPTDKRRGRFERMGDLSQMARKTRKFSFAIENEGTGWRFVPRRRSTDADEISMQLEDLLEMY
jgi:hypothetical protein